MKFHIIHDWSKWSDPIDTMHDYKKVQSRECKICGRVQVKPLRQPFNLWFGADTLIEKMKARNENAE